MGSLTVVGRTAPEQARKDAVRLLEEALEQARRGELVAVAIASVTSQQEARTAWSQCDNHILLLGSICRLQDRLNRAFD